MFGSFSIGLREYARLTVSALSLMVVFVNASVAHAELRLPLVSHTSQIAKNKMALGDWRLVIERGTFSKDVRCHLSDPKHHIVYAAGALGFHFKPHINTLGAWVKIDDGLPARWEDDLPELTRLRVPMDGMSLDNPTDSVVWIPGRQLDEANHIIIQPRANQRPVTFHLNGFAGLREIARDEGCAPEARFVP